MYNFLCSSASQQSNAFASWKRSFSLSGSEAKVWQIMPRPFCCELSKLSWMKSSEEIRSPQRNYCCQRQLFWCLIMPSSVTQRFKVSEHQNMIWGQWRVRNDVSWRSLRKRGLRFVYIFIYFYFWHSCNPWCLPQDQISALGVTAKGCTSPGSGAIKNDTWTCQCISCKVSMGPRTNVVWQELQTTWLNPYKHPILVQTDTEHGALLPERGVLMGSRHQQGRRTMMERGCQLCSCWQHWKPQKAAHLCQDLPSKCGNK